MAQQSIVGQFINQILFKTDKASQAEAQSAISGLKSFATKALGFIGIGFSLNAIKDMMEEFNGINDQIRGATREMGDQAVIQRDILKSAQDCRAAYGDMANYVTNLVQRDAKLFPVEDATQFVSLVEKLEKGAGKESNISTVMSSLNRVFAAGKLETSSLTRMERQAPELINMIASGLDTTKDGLETLAASGTLTAETVKKAIVNSEDKIQSTFDELDYSVTDAIAHIRNSWGFWLEDLDSTWGILNSIGNVMAKFSDAAINILTKVSNGMKKVTEMVGGSSNMFRLLAIAAGSVFLAVKGGAIIDTFRKVLGIVTKLNFKVLLIAAAFAALFLVIDDIRAFFQGGDSLIGRALQSAGIDVDRLKENFSKAFETIKGLASDVFSGISQFWSEHGAEIMEFLGTLLSIVMTVVGGIVAGISDAFAIIDGIINGFKTGDWSSLTDALKNGWQDALKVIDSLGEQIFGDMWEPIKESFAPIFDFLKSAASLISDTFGKIDFGAIWEKALAVFSAIRNFVGIVSAAVAEFWNTHGADIVATLQNILGIATTVFGGILSAVSNVFGMIGGVITGFQTGNWEPLISSLQTMWQSALNNIDQLGQQIFGPLWDPLVNGLKTAWDYIQSFFDWFSGISSSIGDFFGGIGNAVSGLFNGGGNVTLPTASSGVGATNRNNINQTNTITNNFKVSDTNVATKASGAVTAAGSSTTSQLARAIAYGG